MKVQLEITSNKKNIAKKPLTNVYEMNSSVIRWCFYPLQQWVDPEGLVHLGGARWLRWEPDTIRVPGEGRHPDVRVPVS